MGYAREVELIRKACQLDLLTTPYIFSTDDAIDMTKAGADILVAHMGLTTGGSIGAETALKLEDCITPIETWAKAAKRIRKDIIILCHGGPIATPHDAEYIIQNVKQINGFYGASSMERLPVESAMVEQVNKFKEIKF